MHNTICAIMHLFVTYQKKSADFIQCQFFGVFQDRSTVSSLCVGLPSFTVHVAIPVRDADTKHSSSVKRNRRETNIYFFVEQNGRLFLYGDFSN